MRALDSRVGLKMKNAKAVKQLFHTLAGLQGHLALFGSGADDLLLEHGYSHYKAAVEAVRADLENLGLYEVVRDAVTRSEMLSRESKYVEAEMLVLEANRKLSGASGVEGDLRHIYKAANDK
ncbi:hypothetical protein JNX00_09275 [Hydrogenophaga sp. YM1]|uniref:hypothetical protein n=1 Tax=Hydrogenophaga sp. YM1 TaxID=2806262 RepID=UPI00195850C4|nr:hypothetical protein [Hydrogenophaga sp. YM1]QRR36023.1 hypothetical protein JNX00_09275 [Hydrogenophaga sp. YM1]